jgi:predicted AAA+ superfamily ATPase
VYRKRCIDKKIESLLKVKGAINVEGIKWSGKATTAEMFSKSQIYLQDPLKSSLYEFQIKNEINVFLDKDAPLLIDEWQEIPILWDAIRFEVDKRKMHGQFILTSSSLLSFNKKEVIKHSGIGRISKLRMLPMSLYESNDSTGAISLSDLFSNNINLNGIESNISISKLAHLICRGGWPDSLKYSDNEALLIANDYYKTLIDDDFSKYDGVKRDKDLCNAILKSLARNVSSNVAISTLIKDVKSNFNVSDTTIESYLSVLKDLFVLMPVESWNYQLRSSSAIRQSNTKYFTDPSIGTSALSISPNKLLDDFPTFGLFFENLCVRDLKIYANCIDGVLYKYQDRYGLEIDTIIELQDDSWGAFEIKLGEKEFDKAAKNLHKLNDLMIEKKKRPATFLAILTGTKYAYKREDGVLIIPIGCLKD